MTKQDKQKICARLFYYDNPTEYTDYSAALAEVNDLVPDSFLEFSVEPIIRPAEGHRILMKDDEGHVIAYRNVDGYVQFRTDFTEIEAINLQTRFQQMAYSHPEIKSGALLFQKLGWKML